MAGFGIDRNAGAGGSGATQNYTPVTDVFDGDGSTVAFTLTVAPGAASALVVRVSGVVQTPGVDFTVSGTTLTFTTAPASGTDNVVVQNFGVAWSVATVAADGITGLTAAHVSFDQSGTGATSRTMQAKAREVFSVEDFGAVGNGTTDDTSAIQAALTALNVAGGGVVRGMHGKTYLVSQVGTKTINGTAHRYCLLIPDSVYFDLNGATLKLAASQNAALVLNSTAGTTQNANLGIGNGIIDGNQANQTSPAAGEMACVFLHDVVRPQVYNLRAKNVRQYAGRFLKCDKGYFNNLHCEDSDGDGWSFGVSSSSQQVTRSFIDNIYAEGCLGTYSGLSGNGAILTVQYCQIGKIITKDCAGGLKVQDDSQDTDIAELKFIGKTNGSANSGVKIQGNNGATLYPTRINIGLISAQNSYGNGLHITSIHSVSIGRYVGNSNGSGAAATGSDQNDCQLDLSTGSGPNSLQIGAIHSDTPTARGVVLTGSSSGRVHIDSISVRNPTGAAVQDAATGKVYIGTVQAIDDQGSPTMTYAYQGTGTAKGRVDFIETNLTHSTSQSRVTLASGNYDFEIGAIRLGSTDNADGVITLTNTATSKAVTNGHIWRDYVGGSADYFQPLIVIVPWESDAMALNSMRAVVTDGSSGTGFTIHHAAASTASTVVNYYVAKWKVHSAASG